MQNLLSFIKYLLVLPTGIRISIEISDCPKFQTLSLLLLSRINEGLVAGVSECNVFYIRLCTMCVDFVIIGDLLFN